MARQPRLDFRKTPKGWLVNIPASLSDTGRFRRRYFRTRDEAKSETQRLREVLLGHREKSSDIQPDLAIDAIRAQQILAAWNISLTQAAKYYVEKNDVRSKVPTLSQAWETALIHRENHRPRTIADMKSWKKALPAWFLSMNCHDIKSEHIVKALDETTTGQTRWKTGLRNISSVLGDVVKSGAIKQNPVKRVLVKRNPETHDEVTTYTPRELTQLFKACIDYPRGEIDRLCSGCVIPFAFMAFAGIRPEEISKLKWEDVSTELKNIRIGSSISKKSNRRNVRMQPTLLTWIETIPKNLRKGKIIPGRWRYKAAKVRKFAGLDGREKQDALRHSFGSYLLATENDLNLLKSDMGHAHISVYFQHYHKAFTKLEADPYWKVLPENL